MLEALNLSVGALTVLLRLAVVLLLYFFLWQVVRVISRELRTVGSASGPASPYGALVVRTPGQTGLPVGKVFPLNTSNTIGRDLDNDVALPDSFLSATHATLELHGDEWVLSDLNSTNGTFVDGVEVRNNTVVDYGALVRVGRVELELRR